MTAPTSRTATGRGPRYTTIRDSTQLTDAETRLTDDGVPDGVWDEASRHFTDAQLGDLVLAIATINVWNRIGVTTRLHP